MSNKRKSDEGLNIKSDDDLSNLKSETADAEWTADFGCCLVYL